MMAKEIKVVFIDDGINPDFIPNGISFENYSADESGVYPDIPVSHVSHGTMCYQIFHNKIKTDYRLVSVKVLSEAQTGNHKALVSALTWCAGQNIDIINMSMGTQQYTDFAAITNAVGFLSKTVMVAACSNVNELTFPACLDNVIGVRHAHHEALIDKFAHLNNPFDNIEVITCVKDEPVSFGDNWLENVSGTNSFATPLITARLCNYITQGHITIEDIRNRLRADCIKEAGFITYEFYKKLIINWHECTVPVVLFPEDNIHSSGKLKPLLDIFIQDGYRAIALSQIHINTSKMQTIEILDLYYNFTKPDIIFFQMNFESMLDLPKKYHADVVLKSDDLASSPTDLFKKIVKLLS